MTHQVESYPQQTKRTDEYYFRNGLRCVKPYYSEFITHSKKRWLGRELLEIYTQEFPHYGKEYLTKAIEAGKLTVSDKTVTPNTKIQDNQKIAHKVHRHEPPVIDQPIKFLHVDKNVYVVEKPSGLPVHPCGRYKKNSITYILEHEYNLKDLFPIHRIDVHTSGVLIIARSKEYAQGVGAEMMSRSNSLKKIYFAKVTGEFKPMGEIVTARFKISSKDKRAGTWTASQDGTHDSCTFFYGLCYNKEQNTSLLLCRPITGRTHQIRVHLEALGYPIANDSLYNSSFVDKRKNQEVTEEEQIEQPSKRVKRDESENSEPVEEVSNSEPLFETDSLCNDCVKEKRVHTKEEVLRDGMIFLHAYNYLHNTEPVWEYKTDIPYWALEDLSTVSDYLELVEKSKQMLFDTPSPAIVEKS
ncbi:hypothetical protein AKO1_006804 [Acrasis kona]|uniref:Pseudouridine synthase n=1 Tax=Acrasis kona TaxID=1008807 RepID=A0AAW2YTR9_9EUKA